MLCVMFDWNWLSGSEDVENVKPLRTDRKAYLSSQLRWAKTEQDRGKHTGYKDINITYLINKSRTDTNAMIINIKNDNPAM